MSVKVRRYTWTTKAGQVLAGWQVDVIVHFPDGRKIRERRKAPHPTKAAAQLWGDQRSAFLLQNGGPEAEPKRVPTLAEFAETYLAAGRGDRQKASTLYAKKSILDAHLLPLLGKKKLDAIGAAEVLELKDRLKDHRPKTVNNVLAVLSGLLVVAHQLEHLAEPPKPLGMLRVDQDEAPFYDFETYDRLVAGAAKAGDEELLVVLLAGDAGFREGEILALQQQRDVDFKRGRVTIRESDWNTIVDLPKGNRLRRVPLTDRLKAALSRRRSLKSKLVLSKLEGGRLTPKLLAAMVRRAELAAGLPVTGLLHVLRHTFCSHLAMSGATAGAIRELAGHVHLSTTMRYMHLSPAHVDGAIDLLNQRAKSLSTRGTPVEGGR